jgi:dihydrofolate reductase
MSNPVSNPVSSGVLPQRPVVIYAAASVDGYLAPPDGSVGWLEDFAAAGDLGYEEFVAGVGSLVVGRVTFEQVQGFGEWPYGTRPTAVLSSRTDAPEPSLPKGVRLDSGADLAGLVRQLQAESSSGATWVLGGGATHRALLAAGLVTDIWIHVMPILLGDGIPMFPAPSPEVRLDLVETRRHDVGVTLLRYRVRANAASERLAQPDEHM